MADRIILHEFRLLAPKLTRRYLLGHILRQYLLCVLFLYCGSCCLLSIQTIVIQTMMIFFSIIKSTLIRVKQEGIRLIKWHCTCYPGCCACIFMSDCSHVLVNRYDQAWRSPTFRLSKPWHILPSIHRYDHNILVSYTPSTFARACLSAKSALVGKFI
jgi:hypothetical protein